MSKNKDYIAAEIIDDSDEDNNEIATNAVITEEPKKKRQRKPALLLEPFYYKEEDENYSKIEIGIDEVGRGPLFGRVYSAAVVLPKDTDFDFTKLKDSKKFHSKNKINEVSEYIKKNALYWAIAYEDEVCIDNINILQATQSAMHKAIAEIRKQMDNKNDKQKENIFILVDGNYFKPVVSYDKSTNKYNTIEYLTIEGGDNKFCSIAAASILAKVARDTYIDKLCEQNPELIEHYGIDSNKGYGSKKHLDGIKEHGITKWHRKTFGICKQYS